MKIRLLIASLSLVLLVALTFGTSQTGNAKMQFDDHDDFPTLPMGAEDCELRAFQANVACVDKLYTLAQAYYNASNSCPTSTECYAPCNSNPNAPACVQCVYDCTAAKYNSYTNAEESFLTCGFCPASLDFCAEARAAVQICSSNYIECGGFTVAGCYEAYANCRLASGIETRGRDSIACQ